jgi:hypothetical protein
MNKRLLYVFLACGASLGFVAWRVHAVKTQVTPHFEIVEDFSLSHARGCDSLVGLAERVLNTQSVTRNSTLTVLAVGDQTTADEPWRLARYSIPRDDKVLEGRTEKLRRQQDLLRDLRNRCRAARRTTISPIFLGVKQAIADLRAQGCSGTSHCELFVDSDLEENVETSIKKSLNNPSGGTRTLPPPLNNDGIDVTFCGLAVTAGRIVDPSGREIRKVHPRDPGRDDRLRQIWRSLFSRREAVRFEPYCPTPSDLAPYVTGAGSTKGTREP